MGLERWRCGAHPGVQPVRAVGVMELGPASLERAVNYFIIIIIIMK